jgi:hypothetical protein
MDEETGHQTLGLMGLIGLPHICWNFAQMKRPNNFRIGCTSIKSVARLFALIVVLFYPWIEAAAAEADSPPRVGKWGQLVLGPIVLSPPNELVSIDFGFAPQPTWFFPGETTDKAIRALRSAGVSAADSVKLRGKTRFNAQIKGIVLTPDPAWVRALTPEIRARVYRMLAQKSELNLDQIKTFQYPGANPEEWLNPSLVSQHTLDLVKPLIYRNGGSMLFSDIALVRKNVESDDELRRLCKALSRQPTLIARLSIDSAANLDSLVEYWGRGGRRTEIRPLLESIVGGGADRFIDVTHLLPHFARSNLYCYPEISVAELTKPSSISNLWGPLNFFLPKPDSSFQDQAVALKTLEKNYFVVESDFKLGDIVTFHDEKGKIIHASAYIADDLVFGRNESAAITPWALMSLNDVREYCRWRAENPRRIVHRRKNL